MKNLICVGILSTVILLSCQKDAVVNIPLDDETRYNGVYMIFIGNPDMYLAGSGYNVKWTFGSESFFCEVESNDHEKLICRIRGCYRFNDSLEFSNLVYSDPAYESELGLIGKFAYADGFIGDFPDTLRFWQILKANDSIIKKEVCLYRL